MKNLFSSLVLITLFFSCYVKPDFTNSEESTNSHADYYIQKHSHFKLATAEEIYEVGYTYLITKKNDGTFVYRRFYGEVLREELTFLDAKRRVQEGEARYFDLHDGHLYRESNYKANELDGKEVKYYSGGSILEESTFKEGERVGKSISYYESGALKSEMQFVDGREISPRKYFYENGKLERLCSIDTVDNVSYYVSSKLHGSYEYYDSLGNKLCAGVYEDGINMNTDCYPAPEKDPKEIYVLVDEMPAFPGGEEAMMKYIFNEIKYPAVARQHFLSGLVVIGFIVNKDGSLSDFKIKRGIDPSLAEEALRVIKTMPNWKPGLKNGKPERVHYNLPVRYKLE